MLNDETKKPKGKKATPPSGESLISFIGKPDPEIVRLLTPREQWTPAQKRADKRAEAAAHARGAIWYGRVLKLLQTGDLAGAVQAIGSFPGGDQFSQSGNARQHGLLQRGLQLGPGRQLQQGFPLPRPSGHRRLGQRSALQAGQRLGQRAGR